MTDNKFPAIPDRIVIAKFKNSDDEITGEITLDKGADGTWLRFDCDCLDALPFCKAQCCALIGTLVHFNELEKFDYPVAQEYDGTFVMQRDPDGFCHCLDKTSRTCMIYDNRPRTCQRFHCTRGADMRGWKLSNRVHRHSIN